MKNILLISAAVLLLAACSSPMQQEEATLTLHFGVTEARAVYPPDSTTLAKLEHTVTLVGPGDPITRTFEPGIASGNITVVPGSWTISVEAWLVEASGKELYAVGETTVTIEAGENKVTVTMHAVEDGHTHTHTWSPWTIDASATTTQNGTITRTCETDSTHTEESSYADDTSSIFLFTAIIDDNTASVKANGTPSGNIVIPGYYYDGNSYYSVSVISFAAFSGRNEITGVTIPATVRYIDAVAFMNCSNLKNVTFAEDSRLNSISMNAFDSCIGLTTITIPASVTTIGSNAFSGCISLENVTFAKDSRLDSIGGNAFAYCDELSNVTIPASVTTIYRNPFLMCPKLADITVAENNLNFVSEGGILYNKAKTTLIAYPTANGNYAIPAGVTIIGDSAFSYCYDLTSITIPSSVESIGNSAFFDCNFLDDITILPNSALTTISIQAFARCFGLSSIILPDGLTTISHDAFAVCSNLTSITIPASVTTINGNPFYDCPDLAITVDVNNNNYASESGILFNKEMNTLLAWPKAKDSVTLIIPNTAITAIGDSAFNGCTLLTSILIPPSVTTIGDLVFCDCINIMTITIPATVTSVGVIAFGGWTSSQIINVDGHADEADADAAWYNDGYRIWRSECNATIVYQG